MSKFGTFKFGSGVKYNQQAESYTTDTSTTVSFSSESTTTPSYTTETGTTITYTTE